MHRFSISSPCVCFLTGILVSFFFLFSPWSAQNVHGADVTLAWDPNPEANLKGYRVYYGSASGSYSLIVDAGYRTSLTISGLEEGKTYYFAATAYGSAGEESGMSNELRYDTPRTHGSFSSQTMDSNHTAGYTIKASAMPNGSISPSGNISVRAGSSKTFTIRPNRGYRIGRVYIDGVTMNYVTAHTFTRIHANHTIRAEFVLLRSNKKTADGPAFSPLSSRIPAVSPDRR